MCSNCESNSVSDGSPDISTNIGSDINTNIDPNSGSNIESNRRPNLEAYSVSDGSPNTVSACSPNIGSDLNSVIAGSDTSTNIYTEHTSNGCSNWITYLGPTRAYRSRGVMNRFIDE